MAKGTIKQRGRLRSADWGLLDCCEALHMHRTGGSEPLDDAEAIYQYICCRLIDWQTAYTFTPDYDEAVRALCVIAMREYVEHGRQHNPAQRDVRIAREQVAGAERLLAEIGRKSGVALMDGTEQPPAGPSSALPAVLSDSTEEEK